MAQPLPEISTVKTVFDPATCRKRGFVLVSTSSKRSPPGHHLYYELHGSESPSAKRLCFIMGLNNSSFGWHNQVKHFGALNDYSVLVFDNRGVGMSEVPSGMYKTSEMAQDAVELLDFIGWKEERSVNVVGVSMGGMIAQQLALAIPERISSLMLTSTQSGDRFALPTRTSINLFSRLMTNTAGGPEQIIRLVVESLYPQEWLDEDLGSGETRRAGVERDFMERAKITRLQTVRGKIGQMAAGSTLRIVEGGGHALPTQIVDEYNEWIKNNVSAAASLILAK